MSPGCDLCGFDHGAEPCPVQDALGRIVEHVQTFKRRMSEGLCPYCGCEPDISELRDAPAWRIYRLEGACQGCQDRLDLGSQGQGPMEGPGT